MLEIHGKMLMNNKVIVVEWIDSAEYDDADWKSEQELKDLKPMVIKTVGMLVNQDDVYITIASSINNSDRTSEAQYGGLISIPKSAIKKMCTVSDSFTRETMSTRMTEIKNGIWPGPGV